MTVPCSNGRRRGRPRPAIDRRRGLEAPTWVLAAAIYGGWLALTWHYQALPPWLALPLGTWLVAWHGSFQHEALHGHPTRYPLVNAALAWPPLGLWMPYGIYRRSHLAHHRDQSLTCPTDDPESFYVTADDWRALGPFGRGFRFAYNSLAGRLTLGPALHAGRLWRAAAGRLVGGDFRDLGVWLRHLVGVVLVFAWVAGVCGMPAWAYLGMVYGGTALILVRSFAEHRAAACPAHRTALVEAGPLWRLLFLANNYHALHHAVPALPWYELARRYPAERARLLAGNGGYLVAGYGGLFRRYLLRPKEPPIHPYDAAASGQALTAAR